MSDTTLRSTENAAQSAFGELFFTHDLNLQSGLEGVEGVTEQMPVAEAMPEASLAFPESPQERMQFALHHMDLIGYVVKKFVRSGDSRPANDLESDAQLGLIDAASKFTPTGGASFRTYATKRIMGAVMDGNRSYFGRHVEKPSSFLRTCTSLDASIDVNEGTTSSLVEMLPDGLPSQEEIVVNNDTYASLHKAIAVLPDRDKRIITAYYFEGRPMKEIGNDLGVSESRISQIVTRTLKKLRGMLTE